MKLEIKSNRFIQTLIYNVATICAVIVAVFQFCSRKYRENNMNEKIRKFTHYTLNVADSMIEKAKESTADVPVLEVARATTSKSTEGARMNKVQRKKSSK